MHYTPRPMTSQQNLCIDSTTSTSPFQPLRLEQPNTYHTRHGRCSSTQIFAATPPQQAATERAQLRGLESCPRSPLHGISNQVHPLARSSQASNVLTRTIQGKFQDFVAYFARNAGVKAILGMPLCCMHLSTEMKG